MLVHVPCMLCVYTPRCEDMCVDVCVCVYSCLRLWLRASSLMGADSIRRRNCSSVLREPYRTLWLLPDGRRVKNLCPGWVRSLQIFMALQPHAEAEDLFRRWELWSDDPLCGWSASLFSRVQPEYHVLMQYVTTNTMVHLQRKLISKYCGSCAIFLPAFPAFPPLLCRCQSVCGRV